MSELALLRRRQKGLRFIGLCAFAIGGVLALIGFGYLAGPLALIGAIFTWRASYWQGWLDASTKREAQS